MSLDALVWVQQLELDVCDLASYRVLGKLADAHHNRSQVAWRNVDELAAELGCSKRTVQRALRALEQRGLISRADQAWVQHLRADRRPTVWALHLDRYKHQQGPAATPQLPLDELSTGVTAVVTPSAGRAVDKLSTGVTAAVALEREKTSMANYLELSTDRVRECSGSTAVEGAHSWSKRYGTCVHCGARRAS